MRHLIHLVFICLLLISGCSKYDQKEVVVYISLDQVFSEPVLDDFQEKTGIKVKAVYDVEASKTTGLFNRLLAEKVNPQCDVFWNSEVGRTIILKHKGVPEALCIPFGRGHTRPIQGRGRLLDRLCRQGQGIGL
ncbi:MAG: hypothetical protein U9N58_05990 [Thermodesulfobacteriota bacterium]|nr:hypothetical protein [Thermodesulfobacteriota bacterium]